MRGRKIIILLCLILSTSCVDKKKRHITCEQRLVTLGTIYWTNAPVSNLVDIVKLGSGGRWLFLCPNTKSVMGKANDVEVWSDYILVNWYANGLTNHEVELWHSEPPKHYPVIYDRRTTHHNGVIHILMSDGSIKYDLGGKWLRKFAEEHPEFNIALPLP